MGSLFGASAAIVAAVAVLALGHSLAAAVLAVVALVLYLLFYALIRHADPALLKQRPRSSEHQLIALGRAMGKASGGWDLPRRSGDTENNEHRQR
jgi:hypothetical protein